MNITKVETKVTGGVAIVKRMWYTIGVLSGTVNVNNED